MKFALIVLIIIIAAFCLYGAEGGPPGEDFKSIHQLQYEEHETDSNMPMHEQYDPDNNTYYYILAAALITIISVTVYRYRKYEGND